MRNSKFVTVVSSGALAGLLLALSACAESGPGPDTAKGETDSTEQASDVQTEHGLKARGPEGMLREALKTVSLSDAQSKSVEASLATLKNDKAFEKPAVFATLADGVRKGSIDDAAVQKDLAAAQAKHGDQRAKFVSAVQSIHDTLTADQRAQVVEAVESSFKNKMMGRFGKHHEDGEAHEGKGRGMHGPMAKVVEDLELTDAQKTTLETAMKDGAPDRDGKKEMREEMRTRMKASLEAFKADKFDAAASLPNMGGERSGHLEHMVKVIEALTPTLDAQQRTKLADHLAADWKGGWKGKGHAADADADDNEAE